MEEIVYEFKKIKVDKNLEKLRRKDESEELDILEKEYNMAL